MRRSSIEYNMCHAEAFVPLKFKSRNDIGSFIRFWAVRGETLESLLNSVEDDQQCKAWAKEAYESVKAGKTIKPSRKRRSA